MDKGWQEITRGAEIKVPRIFYYIIKYVTPLYLLFIMVNWLVRDAIPIFLLKNIGPADVPYRWGARAMLISLLSLLIFLVWKAWRNRAREIGNGRGVTR
jgi:hypothetical protein